MVNLAKLVSAEGGALDEESWNLAWLNLNMKIIQSIFKLQAPGIRHSSRRY